MTIIHTVQPVEQIDGPRAEPTGLESRYWQVRKVPSIPIRASSSFVTEGLLSGLSTNVAKLRRYATRLLFSLFGRAKHPAEIGDYRFQGRPCRVNCMLPPLAGQRLGPTETKVLRCRDFCIDHRRPRCRLCVAPQILSPPCVAGLRQSDQCRRAEAWPKHMTYSGDTSAPGISIPSVLRRPGAKGFSLTLRAVL